MVAVVHRRDSPSVVKSLIRSIVNSREVQAVEASPAISDVNLMRITRDTISAYGMSRSSVRGVAHILRSQDIITAEEAEWLVQWHGNSSS